MSLTPSWLNVFFEDNQINLEKVLSRKYPQKYQTLLEPLINAAYSKNWPILLPYSRTPELTFYAAAQEHRSLEELRLVLSAFLGSVDTYFDGGVINTSENCAEKALLEHAPAGFIRIKLRDDLNENKKNQVFILLAEVLELYRQRPSLLIPVKRPVGSILRDFILACRISDEHKIWKFYSELKGSERFNTVNLLSLELQALFASHRYSEMLNHNRLPSLLKGRPPLRLLRLLLEALENLGLGQLSDNELISKLSHHETMVLCSPVRLLFLKVPLFESNNIFIRYWKLWITGAVALGYLQNIKYVKNIVESEFIENILIWAEIDKDTLNDVVGLNFISQYKLSSSLYIKSLLDESLDAPLTELKNIWDKIQTSPPEIIEQVKSLPALDVKIKELSAQFSKEQVGGWSCWFTRLGAEKNNIDVLEKDAHEYCESWAVESFNQTDLLECIKKGSIAEYTILRNTLPLILDWLESRDVHCDGIVWLEFLEILALDSIVNPMNILLGAQLAQLTLERPFSIDEYKRIIDAVLLLWDVNKGVEAYKGMLELIDILLSSPCPTPSLRRQLWQSLQDYAIKNWRYLKDPVVQSLTLLLMRDVLEDGEQLPELIDNNGAKLDLDLVEGAANPDLQGKVLGIYSLVEGSARRAAELLQTIFPGLTVKVNSDHTATPSLCHLAKSADYFIFSSRSAKHQAFYAVTNSRKDIIYPHGKGASSIVREFTGKYK